MRRHIYALLVVGVVAHVFGACAAQPRQRPVKTTPIAEGPATMSSVRKQLEGRWTLLSLDVTTEDGRHNNIDATGTLTLDGFGVISIEYRMSEGGQQMMNSLGIPSPNPVISSSGRVVIDPQKSVITYVGENDQTRALEFDRELAARRANPFALERARYYTFAEDGTLTLATRHDNGKDASVSRWKKMS